jgi:ZIP family zinc transporter
MFQGDGLILFGVLLGFFFLLSIRILLERHRSSIAAGDKWRPYKLAAGIGSHNLAKGLILGAAFTMGEGTLGLLLLIGFVLLNLTEGICMAALMQNKWTSWKHVLAFISIAGIPMIIGS